MNKFFTAIVLLFLTIPVWSQQKDYSPYSTLWERFSYLKDSLLASGVDTLIFYHKGNTGCPSAMPPTAILYWQKEGNIRSRIIITKTRYNKRKRQRKDYWEEWASFEPYPLRFLTENANKIESDSVETEDVVFVFGRISETLNANVGAIHIRYNYFDGSREGTRLGYRKGLIDHFRSFFLDKLYRVKAYSTSWK